MKGSILVVLASFGGFQSIWRTEHPCAALRGHKNACEDGAPADDCCKQRGREAPGPRFHPESQTELDGPVVELPPSLLALVIAVPEAAAG